VPKLPAHKPENHNQKDSGHLVYAQYGKFLSIMKNPGKYSLANLY